MTKTERKNLTKLVWVVGEDRRTEHKKKKKPREKVTNLEIKGIELGIVQRTQRY